MSKIKSLLLVIAFFIADLSTLSSQTPPNTPAVVTLNGKELTVRYDNRILLEATMDKDPSTFYLRQITDERNGAVSQVFSITSSDGKKISFTGFINGTDESFPCEAERRQSGTTVVRHTFGLSSSLLNRAVYDRKNDWVLSVDPSHETSDLKIAPVVSSLNANKFSLAISGNEIVFRFRPHYYQKHRGLNYFEPWNYKVWDKSIVGWCSWFAFRGAVTEQDIRETADVISQKMVPFGLDYMQIDDGYQQAMGAPEKWIKPNAKFPSGMDGLAKYISSKGLKPGIWTAVSFADKDFVMKNKTLFVTDSVGNPVSDKYIMYALDGSNKEALDKITRPVYRSFRQMGWQYFKLDGLRHLRYEGYNSNTDYFTKKKTDRIEAFRNVAKAVRDEIGKDNFLLACWGIRPELIGIVDGCRIGNDGYGYESLTKYNSFNNIICSPSPKVIL